MQQTRSPISLPNTANLLRYRRVVIAAGVLAYASASQLSYGVLMKTTQTTDAQGQVQTRICDGTVQMVASGSITAPARVYAADNGKVAATGRVLEGIAITSSTADGDVIEVLPIAVDAVDTIGASTAAAGSTTSDAGALPAGTARTYPTTAADDTKGVKINAADQVTGRMLYIGNGVGNKILKVYPPAGGNINGLGADAGFSSVSGKGVIVQCLDSTANTWLAW